MGWTMEFVIVFRRKNKPRRILQTQSPWYGIEYERINKQELKRKSLIKYRMVHYIREHKEINQNNWEDKNKTNKHKMMVKDQIILIKYYFVVVDVKSFLPTLQLKE